MKNIVFTISALCCTFTTVSYAEIEAFQPTTPKFHATKAERTAKNQLYYLGQATFNDGIKVPSMA